MRRLALTSLAAVMMAAIAGCGGDPAKTKAQFKKEVENYFNVQNRGASDAKEAGSPLVHEYRDVQIPEPKGERGVLSAVASYILVTSKREVVMQAIPQEPVDATAKPDSIVTRPVSGPVYLPILYRRGRINFKYDGAQLTPDRVPFEEPLTEAERLQVINAPVVLKEPAAVK